LRISIVTIAIALVFAALYGAAGLQLAETAKTHDFLNLYAGARLALEGRWQELHDPVAQLEVERRYRDVHPLRPFVRPPFYAALLAPVAALPFELAFRVWTATWWMILAVCCWWAAQAFHSDALVLGALFLPAALGIAHGQDCVFMLAVMAASYSFAERDKPLAAGAIAGLLVVKFHLGVLFPVLLIVQRRWRMLGGFCAVASLCAMFSVALAGRDGVLAYVRLLTRNDIPLLSPGRQLMVNGAGLLMNIGVTSKAAELAVAIFGATLAVIAARGPAWRLYPAAAAGALIAMPHTYAYDAAFLLPGLWAVVYRSQSRAAKAVAVALCTPIPYGLNLADAPWPAITPVLLLLLLGFLAAEPLLGSLPSDEESVRRNILPVGNKLTFNGAAVPPEKLL
jgi:hypothetical protein